MEEMLALARGKLKQEPPGGNGALILHDFAGGPLPGRYGRSDHLLHFQL